MEGEEESRTRLLVTEEARNGSTATLALFLSTVVAVLGSFTVGCATGYTSPAESGIIKDLNLSLAAFSLFASVTAIGGIIGSIINVRVTDLIGRKGTLWLSQLFFILGWLATVVAKNALWLDLGRLSMGVGFSLTNYVVPVYIAEITPRNLRGTYVSCHQFVIACGVAFVYFIGSVLPWRMLALVGAIPSIVQVLSLFFTPESPRWLGKTGREKELEAILECLRGKKADILQETAEIIDYSESLQRQSEARILDVFQRRYAYSLTVAVGLILFQQFSGYNAILSYLSSIFESADFSGSVGPIALAVIQIPATALSLFLADKSGRKPLLLVSAAGMCLSHLIVALGFFLQDLHKCKELTPIMVLIGTLGYIISVSMGMSGLPWVILAEIIPMNIKGPAGGVATLATCVSTWIVTYAFNFAMEWSSAGTFLIFSGVCAFCVVFIAKLVPETKGRTLEGLQASLNDLQH